MKVSPDDTMLRQQFAEQKARDAARTPAFEQVLRSGRAPHRGMTRGWPSLWLSVAAAAVVAAVLVAVTVHTRRVAEQRVAAQALAAAQAMWNWESPTDFLIEDTSDGQNWMSELPSFPQPSQPVPSTFDDESSNSTSKEGSAS